MFQNKIFYIIKPIIPRRFQIFLRRQIVCYKRKKNCHCWPIDPESGKVPEGWQGWPDNRKFALVILHDVDTQKGHDKCYQLMNLDESLGFRSSFNFVPEKYIVSETMLKDIFNKGFEVCVHGLKHDGKLFSSRTIFERRAKRINQYLKKWNAEGFTTPSMLRNPKWIIDLNITHCISTFDTDPFEPQPEAAKTLFPFWIQNISSTRRYLELPYTLPQDFTLFVLMKERTLNIWKKKLDWIVQKGGMALFNSHPDYMNFNKGKNSMEEYSVKFYENFLTYIKNKYEGQFWNALPKEVVHFWKGMKQKE